MCVNINVNVQFPAQIASQILYPIIPRGIRNKQHHHLARLNSKWIEPCLNVDYFIVSAPFFAPQISQNIGPQATVFGSPVRKPTPPLKKDLPK